MKKSKLQELIRHITRGIMQEFLPPANNNGQVNGLSDPSISSVSSTDLTNPDASISPVLKSRIDREKEKQRRDNIKNKEAELKTAKSKIDAQKRETDQLKRFTTPQLQKSIQQLKGAKI